MYTFVNSQIILILKILKYLNINTLLYYFVILSYIYIYILVTQNLTSIFYIVFLYNLYFKKMLLLC